MNRKKSDLPPDISAAAETLLSYKRAKSRLEADMETEKRIWEFVYRGQESSSWIFNSIVNKHADIIDNIPTCTCLPRERKDEEFASALSRIIPVISQRCNFEQTYSDNSWEKLKHGTAVYGVLWNGELEDGLGDIDIRKINLSDIFWDISVSDIQQSKNVFVVALADVDEIEMRYPHFRYAQSRNADSTLSSSLGNAYGDGRCTVVDWYYKKYSCDGRTALHYCKFVGDTILYSTEQDSDYAKSGWYEHGQYPFVFDRMYPKDGGVCGFGMIAIGSGIQGLINRIDDNVLKYSDWASRVRFWAKRSLGVNEKDFLDLDKSIVEVEGDIDNERLKQIEISPLDGAVIDFKKLKIDELKEVTGSRDVSQGGISGGVTAASAISILREAGAKSSRDGIEETYRVYIRIISLVIELIRQFYKSPRIFRIVGESGKAEYLSFSGNDISGDDDGARPFFDVEIDAVKRSPSEAQQRNELIKGLYDSGAFEKEKALQTLAMLELMDFDGVGRLKAFLRKNYNMESVEII